jgi:hypothetical protein
VSVLDDRYTVYCSIIEGVGGQAKQVLKWECDHEASFHYRYCFAQPSGLLTVCK